MKKNLLLMAVFTFVASLSITSCSNNNNEFDEKGRMILNLRNLYFNEWTGGDTYTSKIEEKFNVSISPTSYSWADWDSQVWGPVNANNLSDVFHFDIDSYNFANSYIEWVEGDVIKALPSDMSKWPNVKKMIEKTSNIDKFYVDGKLYCLPIVKNINGTATAYSPFTYVYRRDWAKQLNVYKENDIYSWDEFQTLLKAFYENKCEGGDIVALADVEWGYPSITNFYKDVPHCFALDENGKVVANYTTSKYLEGLEIARNWTVGTKKYYGLDQYAQNDGDVAKKYYAGRIGVFYENLSLANYTTLRKQVSSRSEIETKEQLDDATAIMKVKGPDNKFALEGTENWFSATFFNADMSNEKQGKILDILDYLLSDEGTMMALYGIEGYDYIVEDGKVTLLEQGWEKDMDGNYVEKLNGAKFLRYMATLGYDTNALDPLVDKDALKILNDWQAFMDEKLKNNELRVLEENSQVKWLYTTNKAKHSGTLLSNANTAVIQYCNNKISFDTYKKTFESNDWKNVLEEINNELGK